jgi:twitching motility protein PilT
MMRTLRMEVLPRTTSGRPVGIARLLGLASTASASALYLTSQSRPLLRIGGDIRAVEGEPTLTSAQVEASVLELMPESARGAHGRGESAEWVTEVDEIGRVRCSTFNDYRGAGALFQLISAKPPSAEQLGFTREIQQLATESDGLVLVAGPQGGGKSSLVAGLVDFVNRERGGYVITLERQIRIVHENRQALVSQREVRGEAVDIIAVTRAALRENPDVLVIEDLYAPDVIQLALDAAGSGVLIFLSVTAASTVTAIARVVEMFPPDRRNGVQAALAERLRGAVSQVLLRRNGGGRIAARELLLATAAVSTLIGEGQFAQLAVALDSGRRQGMVSLNDALHQLLRSGAVDVREAYRKTDDRAALLALLKADGVDTSFVEQLA